MGTLALVAPIDGQAFERQLLEYLCHEADWGLWEPLWQLNSDHPEEDPAVREQLVEATLRSLYDRGLIVLYRKAWADAAARGVTLTAEETSAALAASWWRTIPLDQADVWIRAT